MAAAFDMFELLARGSVVQPRTILKGVMALPSGHRMVIERDAGASSATGPSAPIESPACARRRCTKLPG